MKIEILDRRSEDAIGEASDLRFFPAPPLFRELQYGSWVGHSVVGLLFFDLRSPISDSEMEKDASRQSDAALASFGLGGVVVAHTTRRQRRAVHVEHASRLCEDVPLPMLTGSSDTPAEKRQQRRRSSQQLKR